MPILTPNAFLTFPKPNTVHLVEAVRNDPGCRLWEAFADQAK